MGDSATSTVYAAELQGIRLALTMALEDWSKGHRRTKVVIYTDNQAAIRTVSSLMGKSGAYIVSDIVHLIDRLQASKRVTVEIRWISARKTMCAGNQASPPARLYPLRTTMRTWIKLEVQKEWEYNWSTETRGRVNYKYTPRPTHKILRQHEGISKRRSSSLVQLRTENIGLRNFLYRKGVPEITDPHCPCGEGRETVMHVLLRCRRFKDLRRQELSGIPGRSDLRPILNGRKATTRAINFIDQTQILGQFRIGE
jgi:hypothetical protein